MSEVKKPLKIISSREALYRAIIQAIVRANPDKVDVKWDDFDLYVSFKEVQEGVVPIALVLKSDKEIIERYRVNSSELSDSVIKLGVDRFNLPLIKLSDLLTTAGYKETYNNLDEYTSALESLREYPWIEFTIDDRVNRRTKVRETVVKAQLDNSKYTNVYIIKSLISDIDFAVENDTSYVSLNGGDIELIISYDEAVIKYDPTAVEKDPLDELNTNLDMDTANLIKPPGTYKLEMPELRGGVLHIYNHEIYAND